MLTKKSSFVAAEDSVPSPGGGDLGFGTRFKWHNVDFGPACLIGEISQPPAIGREAAVVLADRHVGGGGRLEGLRSPVKGRIQLEKTPSFDSRSKER
jgi:hypothetical protein